jgi:hypothetical protein
MTDSELITTLELCGYYQSQQIPSRYIHCSSPNQLWATLSMGAFLELEWISTEKDGSKLNVEMKQELIEWDMYSVEQLVETLTRLAALPGYTV